MGVVHELVRTNPASRPELLGLYMVHSLREKQAQMATNGGSEELESAMSGGRFSEESSGEGGEEPGPQGASSSYPSNSLWLAVSDRSQTSNGWVGITIHGTVAGVACDLYHTFSLKSPVVWTNWTKL